MAMSRQDWDNCIAEWKVSCREEFASGNTTFEEQYLQKPLLEPAPIGKFSFIRKGRKTRKAQFYFTDDGINGDFGFWVPHSAIISELDNYVEIANWCKITVIPFN